MLAISLIIRVVYGVDIKMPQLFLAPPANLTKFRIGLYKFALLRIDQRNSDRRFLVDGAKSMFTLTQGAFRVFQIGKVDGRSYRSPGLAEVVEKRDRVC